MLDKQPGHTIFIPMLSSKLAMRKSSKKTLQSKMHQSICPICFVQKKTSIQQAALSAYHKICKNGTLWARAFFKKHF